MAKVVMRTSGFHHIPIENIKGELVGIVSNKLLAELEHDNVLLEDCMIQNVLTATATTTIEEASHIMYRTQVNCPSC